MSTTSLKSTKAVPTKAPEGLALLKSTKAVPVSTKSTKAVPVKAVQPVNPVQEALKTDYVPARGKALQHKHPTGWEPGVTISGDQGTLSTGPVDHETRENVDWSFIMEIWNVDPTKYEVIEPVEMRAWDSNLGDGNVKRFYYYKARFQAKRVARDENGTEIDIKSLVNQLRKIKVKPRSTIETDTTFVVTWADFQVGKLTWHAKTLFENALTSIVEEIKQTQKYRPGMRQLAILGLGDLIEGCDDFYAQQTFTVDLNLRDQIKLVREMLLHGIKTLAPYFDDVLVACVGGNHGENRRNGKSFTDMADNVDVAVFEHVKAITDEVPALQHVRYVIPNNELAVTFELQGKIVGIIHGHQVKSGSGMAGDKIWKWWKDQAHGRQPVGDADILFSGHNHHHFVVASGGRVLVGCPSIELGSEWWTNMSGQGGMPAMLTAMIDKTGLIGHRLVGG